MKKKSRGFKKAAGLALVAILTAAQVMSTAIVTKAADPIILAPENMVQFDIVDQDGNAVDGVEYTIVNSANVEVAKFNRWGDFTSLNQSGITSGSWFAEPRSTFEKLVAPAKLESMRFESEFGYSPVIGDYYIDGGAEETFTIRTLPVMDTALTVPANTAMVNIDAKWANSSAQHTITSNGQSYNLNNKIGTLTSVPLAANGTVTFSNISGGTDASYPYTLSTAATEYVKVRVKLSDITDGMFNDKGVYIREGEEVPIASGTSSESVVWIVSGAVINVPVPDANGYIEIYVEKTERKYKFQTSHHGASWWGGGSHGEDAVVDSRLMTVRAVDFPTDVNYMLNVPKGTYTINVTSVPNGYDIPAPITFTVQDSQQFQTAKIVLPDEHTHSYGSTYSSDVDNHWNECECGAKGNVAAHIPGPAATEDRAQTCTVCGYEIAPKLQHTHSYGSTYSSDADNHWNECECGAKGNVAAHIPGPAATEQRAQTCTVCGYEIAPKLQHTHSYGSTYSSDEDNHWNVCACGAKGNEAAHSFKWITDKAATESEVGSKHEECNVCGYEKASVEIPKLTPSNPTTPSNPSTPAAPSAPAQADVKDVVPDTGDIFPMGIAVFGGLALVSGLALVVFYGRKKSVRK